MKSNDLARLLLLYSLLLPITGYTQEASLQSIKQRNAHDTTNTNAYLDLGRYYANRQPDSAFFYTEQAISLATKISFYKGMVLALSHKAKLLRTRGDFAASAYTYKAALTLAERQNLRSSVATIFNSLGNLYTYIAKQDSALFFLNKSLVLREELHDEKGIINSYMSLGNFYAFRRRYHDAKRYYIQGLSLAERPANRSDNYFKLLINVGNIHYELEHYDSADLYYKKALLLKMQLPSSEDWNTLYHNMGNIYLTYKKDYKTALEFYFKSLTVSKNSENAFQIINSLNNIGNVYRLQGDYAKALQYYEDAMAQAQKINSQDQVKVLIGNIALCNESMHDLALALKNFKKEKALSDSLDDLKKNALLAEMEAQYKTQEKEKKLILQSALLEKKTYQRNASILSSAFLFVLLGVSVFVYLRTRTTNRTLSSQKKTIEKREREKELLLRELHHRAKNNLQLVSSLLNLQAHQLKDSEAAEAVKEGQARVEAMALIHRDLYLKEHATRVNLKKYVSNLVNNLIDSYNFSQDSLSLVVDIADIEMDADVAIPIGLITNELIINAFKYAFTCHQHPELVIIAGEMEHNELHILIRDNGQGMSDNSVREGSFGVTMINSLVKQLQGSITFENAGGCVATLILPLEKNELAKA